MAWRAPTWVINSLNRSKSILRGPQILAFVPAITLAAFWAGGETALLITAVLIPAAWIAAGGTLPGLNFKSNLLSKGPVTPDR